MGYLERIDKNVDPLLAQLWLYLAFYQSLGVERNEEGTSCINTCSIKGE